MSNELQGIFAVEAAIRILSLHGLKGNQLMRALDKVYEKCAGFSLLDVAGVQLPAPLTTAQMGEELGLYEHDVNNVLATVGYQQKVAGQWMPLGDGELYAVMHDTGKVQSDGKPICELRWDDAILDVFYELMVQAEERGLEL